MLGWPCGGRHHRGGSATQGARAPSASALTAQRGFQVVTPIDPTSAGVPARGEPQHADARRRAAAVREARGGRAQLRPRDVRGDARRRRDRAAVPQAPVPLAAHRRPAGVEGRRAVRHRAPRPAQRAPQARPDPRAPRALRRGCTAPGSPGSGRSGRRTSSRACATAGSRCTPRPTTPSSTASRRCGCSPACSAPTRTSATCRRRGPPRARARRKKKSADLSLSEVPMTALRAALGITTEAAGMPSALVKTITKGLQATRPRRSPCYAPRTIFNQSITGSRRFAAQDWPIERLRAIGKATGTTLNDVVIAMCTGAMRDLPARARRAARGTAGLDGAGRPQRQAVAGRLVRGRQRGRLGHGPDGHRPERPRRPPRDASTAR